MTLIVEDGTGVSGAESYASTSYIDTYWTNRPQRTYSATWLALTTPNKEGCAREASAYIDAIWGPYYRGVRYGWVQGLLWPRTGAFDEAQSLRRPAYELPDLPACLLSAVAELAVRASAAILGADLDRGGMIKMLKAGSVQVEYVDGAPARPTYGVIGDLLAPILNGSQPDAPNENWVFL